MFVTMQVTLALFNNLTDFILVEFEELMILVVPTMTTHTKFTNGTFFISKKLSKLTSKQYLLNFNLYMKHDNVIIMYCVFM
jgi:hypothetical protein